MRGWYGLLQPEHIDRVRGGFITANVQLAKQGLERFCVSAIENL